MGSQTEPIPAVIALIEKYLRRSLMDVTSLIHAAFTLSSQKNPALHQTWVRVSVYIGSKLPNSLLMVSVQRAGELDMLLRCMEDDFSAKVPALSFNYQVMFSELWIGQVYELVRLLKQRNLGPVSDVSDRLMHDLTLVRIPLEKHEIARDSRLKDKNR